MRALLIVDVQNDFVEGGALGVDGGKKVARKIEHWLARRSYDAIFASRDSHLPDCDNGGHFSDTPDFKDSWPVHCVRETHGWHYALHLPNNLNIIDIYKGMGTPSYSMYEGEDINGTKFPDLVRPYRDLDVVGIATDYCVKETVGDAIQTGARVNVLSDMVAGVAPESTEEAIATMRRWGAYVAPSHYTCITCGSEGPIIEGNNPSGGVDLSSTGNYGSKFFDNLENTTLRFTMCDGCVKSLMDKGDLFHEGDHHPVTGWRDRAHRVGYITARED